MSALLQAAELVVRNFCVGEALSIPLLRGSWHAAGHPLIKAVLGRIVKDEAAHGQFGWFFLEWAEDQLTEADRAHLTRQAALTINAVVERWRAIKPLDDSQDPERLGWMESSSYLALARRSMQQSVIAPLARHGLDVAPWLAS